MSDGKDFGAGLGRTLGVVAIAFGMGIAGALLLDLHGHQCPKCGRRWKHLGAFNFGDKDAHSCPACGTTQWWRAGFNPETAPRAFADEIYRNDPRPWGTIPATTHVHLHTHPAPLPAVPAVLPPLPPPLDEEG